MIHISIGGQAFSAAQSQRVSFAGYMADTVNTAGPLAVGTAAVQVLDTSAVTPVSWYVIFKNVSLGGQVIALGFAATVTVANSGLILLPGDEWSTQFLDQNIWAIASAANGILNRFALTAT